MSRPGLNMVNTVAQQVVLQKMGTQNKQCLKQCTLDHYASMKDPISPVHRKHNMPLDPMCHPVSENGHHGSLSNPAYMLLKY